MNLFCLLLCFSRQTKQICLFAGWFVLWCAQTAFSFIWPLLAHPNFQILRHPCRRHNCSCLFPRLGQARIDYLAPLFDDNTIILKNDDRRFIVLLTEYVLCTYFHKNNKSQLDIPFVLEFTKPISLTDSFYYVNYWLSIITSKVRQS